MSACGTTNDDGGEQRSNGGGPGDHPAPPDWPATAENWQHPPHPSTPPLLATCSALHNTRVDSRAEHMTSRPDGRRRLQSARIEQDLSVCKARLVWSESLCGGAVACTIIQKRRVPCYRESVAPSASSLSLLAAPPGAASRLLPDHVAMSACAHAQEHRVA